MQTIGIGIQNFETIRRENIFYIDKTSFIGEWWKNKDDVTLIARPRRFGKTLTMDMLEKFFSVEYAGRSELFEGLKIWEDAQLRSLQGTYPVIFVSFANVKEKTYQGARASINQILSELYVQHAFLRSSELMKPQDLEFWDRVTLDMEDRIASVAIHKLCDYLYRYYHKKVLIFLDEYDTPMQEAYVDGYWEEYTGFMRNLFNATFKTNPFMERAIMTGITRVSKESVFSDLNNMEVVTTSSEKYCDCFGFTEEEVFSELEKYGLSDEKQEVKDWYDGFVFGSRRDIYNPWSIINYLDKKKLGTYWANTSSNQLVSQLIRESGLETKQDFETLLKGGTIHVILDEQIIYDQLSSQRSAIWSLLLASGYLKADKTEFNKQRGYTAYDLKLTNRGSGLGRYDVMLEPLRQTDKAFIIEFKVLDPEEETSLKDTVESALAQIDGKKYETELTSRGILPENIQKYGVAFQGKQVLIGKG